MHAVARSCIEYRAARAWIGGAFVCSTLGTPWTPARAQAQAPASNNVAAPAAQAPPKSPTAPEAPKAPTPPDFAPARQDPLWSATRSQDLLSGFVQLDYLHKELSFDELGKADRKPLNDKRFFVRNARLRLRKAWSHLALQSEVELFRGQGFARPVNLELRARTPKWWNDRVFFEAQAGLFPVAFGFEMRDQGHPLRFFGERSDLSRAFIPGRFDIGVGLIAHLGPVDWSVALQNGQPLDAPGFSYLDPNRQKDLSTRLRIFSEPTCWLKIRGGASYLRGTGFSGGTPPSKDRFEWIDLDQDGRVTQAELLPIVGSAGRPSQNFKRWAVGADLQIYAALPVVGTLALYAEGAWGQNMDRAIAIADPILLGRDQRSFGYYIGVRQELTRFVEIGARYQHYEPNADRLELFEGLQVIAPRSFQTISGGAALRYAISPKVRTRLFGEYEWQKNSLGRDPNGRPGPLDNDTFRLRWELVF